MLLSPRPNSCVLLQPYCSPLFHRKLWLWPSLPTLPNYTLCFPPPPHPHPSILEPLLMPAFPSELSSLLFIYPKSVQPPVLLLRPAPSTKASSVIPVHSDIPLNICGFMGPTLMLSCCWFCCSQYDPPARLVLLAAKATSSDMVSSLNSPNS